MNMQKVFGNQLIVAFAVLQIVSPIPVPRNDDVEFVETKNKENHSAGGTAALIPFLRRFGYIQQTNTESATVSPTNHEMIYEDDRITRAITEMQRFGALKQTGYLDNETLALISKPRCGVPDVVSTSNGLKRTKRFVIGGPGWNKRRLTYRVDNWTPQLDEGIVLSDMQRAFAVWADYARLNFINKPRHGQDDVDIAISFGKGYHGDEYPFDGNGGVLAHAFFPNGHGSRGGDIHFDLDEKWVSNLNQNFESDYRQNVSFFAVAVHEIGHSLGLAHSPSKDSVMFPYYQGYEAGKMEDLHLGYDDIMAMYQLYIQREIKDTDGNYHKPSTTSAPTSTKEYPSTTTAIYEATSRRTVETVTTETSKHTTVRSDSLPNICQDSYDSIAFMRNELFVFRGKYMWRIQNGKISQHIYPAITSRLFPMLENVDKIDAALENDNGQLVFFSGKSYWIYDGGDTEGPMSIADFGLPDYLDKVDAVFIWEKNKKMYFFSGDLMWRYDTSTKTMDEGYPANINRWRGIPDGGIDSVITWSDGNAYFFKKEKFWKFDDSTMRTSTDYHKDTSTNWFGC